MRSWTMRSRTKATPAPADPARRSGSPDVTRRASALASVLAIVALEVLPITAWLESGAASRAGDARLVAVPIWLLGTVVLTAWGMGSVGQRIASGRRARTRAGVAWTALWTGVVISGWLLTLLVLLRVAPGDYAGFATRAPFGLDWLGQIPADVLAGSPRVLSMLGLALLNAYLWWRGLRWGSEGTLHDRVSWIFRVGLGAVVLAIVFAVAVPAPARTGLIGRLALVLPLEVAAGLMALALGHITEFTRMQPHRAGETPLSQPVWLLTALVLSGTIVGGALALGALFSVDVVAALPAGLLWLWNGLLTVVQWIFEAIGYVLFLLFGVPLEWIFKQLTHSKTTVHVPVVTLPPGARRANHTAGVPAEWLLIGRVVFVVLVVLVVLYVLARIVNRLNRLARPADFEETRESLDARGLLRAQVRALFGRRAARASDGEDLPRASIRRVYRDLLRGALRAGHGRRATETPLEYERRLASAAVAGTPQSNGTGLPAGDMTALTRLYERARYGETPGTADDQTAASALGQRLAGCFARHKRR